MRLFVADPAVEHGNYFWLRILLVLIHIPLSAPVCLSNVRCVNLSFTSCMQVLVKDMAVTERIPANEVWEKTDANRLFKVRGLFYVSWIPLLAF